MKVSLSDMSVLAYPCKLILLLKYRSALQSSTLCNRDKHETFLNAYGKLLYTTGSVFPGILEMPCQAEMDAVVQVVALPAFSLLLPTDNSETDLPWGFHSGPEGWCF